MAGIYGLELKTLMAPASIMSLADAPGHGELFQSFNYGDTKLPVRVMPSSVTTVTTYV